MPNHFFPLLLLLTVANLHLLSSAKLSPPSAAPSLPQQPPITPPPPPLTSSPPPPLTSSPPPTQPQGGGEQQQDLLNKIIDALIGAGDFAGYASILSNTNPSSSSNLPLTSTFFIPNNTALTAVSHFDPFMIPYHIIPQRLSFSDLLLFKPQTRLPTLLPSKTVVVTSNSPTNFTIDDSPITHPDMYVTSAVSVHGIGSVLDYSTYGGSFFEPPPSGPVLIPPPTAGESVGSRKSDAACSCAEYPVVFTIIFAFASKILRSSLKS